MFAAIALLSPTAALTSGLLGVSAGFLTLPLVTHGRLVLLRLGVLPMSRRVHAMLEDAPGAAVLTDGSGRILAVNNGAEQLRCGPGQRDLPGLFQRFCVDPDTTVRQLIERVRIDGQANIFLGTLATGTQVRVNVLSRERWLWVVSRSTVDPELALLTVLSGVATPNAAAERVFGRGVRPLAEMIADLPMRQGGIHQLRHSDGSEFKARLIELNSLGDGSEIAVVPCASPTEAPSGDHATVPTVPDLLSVLPVPMLKVDEKGMLLEANSEARSILTIERGALPPLFELVEGMGRPIADWLSDAAQGRGLLKPEIVRAVVPGQELYLQITLGRMVEAGKVVLVGILNDATELKTLEAQFVQSQKMQAIGQLAGGVAHDFNNLLTAISGHCDLLLLRHEASDPDYADLIQISHNANRAASLVGQLLAFSRKQNLKPQALELRDTMADLVHLLNRLIGEKVQLEVSHAPGPQMIRADRRQLEQVIVNLVVNARDAMVNGGKIEVLTRTEFLSEEVLRDRARLLPGEYVVIEVKDNGGGIAPEAVSKIFEPFFTTKKTGEGTGLGLSTAYGIVKQTGGFIFVDSVLGEGTVFTLYFPASSSVVDTAPPPPRTEMKSTTAHGDAAILLVEDEAPVRAFACRALRLRGYTVIEASDAEMALSILEDKSLRIDLFVTDVIMPGMDGPTWVRKALKDRPNTAVVFMSGYAEEGRAEKQARIPNSVFLPKPFSLQQFTALVQERLS
ncbi:MAG: response regulator [Silicimonas sp.]|nr:response regulator [Silicimonas sp.]